MTLKKILKSDLVRLLDEDERPVLLDYLKWYFIPKGSTFPYNVWFRLLQWSKKNKITKYTIGLFFYIAYKHYTYKYGIFANANIDVGEGLMVVHGSGVYLNCKSIGNHFTVYQGVTLGSHKGGIPTIKDNVTIYPGAVVVGDIVLNSGCIIGANAYVSKDVPSNAVVAGVPAKIIRNNDNQIMPQRPLK